MQSGFLPSLLSGPRVMGHLLHDLLFCVCNLSFFLCFGTQRDTDSRISMSYDVGRQSIINVGQENFSISFFFLHGKLIQSPYHFHFLQLFMPYSHTDISFISSFSVTDACVTQPPSKISWFTEEIKISLEKGPFTSPPCLCLCNINLTLCILSWNAVW